jgi:hypothetical protein
MPAPCLLAGRASAVSVVQNSQSAETPINSQKSSLFVPNRVEEKSAESKPAPAPQSPNPPIPQSPIRFAPPCRPGAHPVPSPGVPPSCAAEIPPAETPINSQKSSLFVPNRVKEKPAACPGPV